MNRSMRLRVGDVPLAQPRVEPSPDAIHLDRRLGTLDATAIIVSNVIGGGILFTPPRGGVVALFVLRGREPQATRAFRAWGYPVTPALYVVVSMLILLNGCVSRPLPTGAGLLVMGAGMPIYWWFSGRRWA
jgi:amino acid transporter